MKAYECIILVDPRTEEVEVDKITAKIEEYIQKNGAILEATNKWGKKRLAYEIKKITEAYYVQFNYKAGFEFNREFEKSLKFINGIIRAITFCAHVDKKPARAAVQTM